MMMMSSLLTSFLLTAADPTAAALPNTVAAAPAAARTAANPDTDCDGLPASRMPITPQGVSTRKNKKPGGKTLIKASPQLYRTGRKPCLAGEGARMAIDELGMPVDYKDKKGKGVVTGGQDCDDGAAACRAAACSANVKVIVDTYGGHGAHGGHGAYGGKPIAISESSAHAAVQETRSATVPRSSAGSSKAAVQGCPAPAGMAINEKGTAGKPTPKTSPK
jgi:hypothetical protein